MTMETVLYRSSWTLPPDTDMTGHLKKFAADRPGEKYLLAFEPRIIVPRRNGRPIIGRLDDAFPLTHGLPPEDLPLAEAWLYYAQDWLHILAGSKMQPLRAVHWLTSPTAGCTEESSLLMRERSVFLWQDRQRFGLSQGKTPESCRVREYYRGGSLLTFHLLAGVQG